MRPARLCRESATPTWLARAPLRAAVISCCVLPVTQRKDWTLLTAGARQRERLKQDGVCVLPRKNWCTATT